MFALRSATTAATAARFARFVSTSAVVAENAPGAAAAAATKAAAAASIAAAPAEEAPKPKVQDGRQPNNNNNNGNRPRAPQTNGARNAGLASTSALGRRTKSRQVLAERAATPAPHLLTLADCTPEQIEKLVLTALAHKLITKTYGSRAVRKTLSDRSVALMFSKRSTRTRVASESSVALLGGHSMFLGSQDIQLGVNESLRDTATVVGSMVDGIMARVNGHEEVETLAKYSPVPVVNALSDLYHPTQILADLLTLLETYSGPITLPESIDTTPGRLTGQVLKHLRENYSFDKVLKGKKMAWVGDTNNMTNEFLVVMPRLGMHLGVAAPKGYDKVDPRVWARVTEAKTENLIQFTNSPAEALKNADIVVTDTWISMGQEDEKAARLAAFEGYQLTNKLITESGARPDWKFMHCLPRHQEEVDDEVFYGDRSIVFPEAENRKWTIMAVFDALMGNWAYF